MTGNKRGVSATVRRRRLGAELRRLREAAGLTIDQVADKLEFSASKISRLETGHTGASARDVRDMLLVYGVPEEDLASLVEIARETRQRGWWQPYGSIILDAYVAFETSASALRSYEAQCVPGLLQTEAYARSLMIAGSDFPVTETDNRVRVRMARQGLLTQEEPIDFWCVIDEAALVRPVGGEDVLRDQLRHLTSMADRPNVRIQILPFAVGAHPGMDGSFSLFRFPDEADADTVYVAQATGGTFLDKPDDLARFEFVFDRLQSMALTPGESIALLTSMVKE